MEGKDLVYDDSEPLGTDPHLVVPLEQYHSNHVNPECRAYKLLGIYLDDKLIFNNHTNFLCNKLNRSFSYTFCAQNSLFCFYIYSHILTTVLSF
jgi:hypothetical protein